MYANRNKHVVNQNTLFQICKLLMVWKTMNNIDQFVSHNWNVLHSCIDMDKIANTTLITFTIEIEFKVCSFVGYL